MVANMVYNILSGVQWVELPKKFGEFGFHFSSAVIILQITFRASKEVLHLRTSPPNMDSQFGNIATMSPFVGTPDFHCRSFYLISFTCEQPRGTPCLLTVAIKDLRASSCNVLLVAV